jgi:hypothetical protein
VNKNPQDNNSQNQGDNDIPLLLTMKDDIMDKVSGPVPNSPAAMFFYPLKEPLLASQPSSISSALEMGQLPQIQQLLKPFCLP